MTTPIRKILADCDGHGKQPDKHGLNLWHACRTARISSSARVGGDA
jgi:hypothetical protein